MSVRIITADVMEGLAQLPDGSVHCVCTSPPYWGLRDYGTGRWEGGAPDCDHRSPTMREGRNEERPNLAGSVATNSAQLLLAHASACGKCGAVKVDLQIGLEPTPDAFVARMVEVFREVRRVLRKDGTLWLNMGDSYCNSDKWGGGAANTGKHMRSDGTNPLGAVRRRWSGVEGIKPKDLMGMPWRVAFALQADGWWLRGDYIWAKSNLMPESVRDRCTKAHEYIFHLAKSERYYWDAEAIKETALWPEGANAPDKIKSPYGQGFTRANIGAKGNANTFRGGSYTNGKPGPRTVSGNVRRTRDIEGGNSRPPGSSVRSLSAFEAANGAHYPSRNKRSVWEMAAVPFDGEFCTACSVYYDGLDKRAIRVEIVEEGGREVKRKWCRCGRHDAWLSHFATFPPDLPATCIAAGTSEHGCCAKCGAPWVREVSVPPLQGAWNDHENDLAHGSGARTGARRKAQYLESLKTPRETLGWEPSCSCGPEAGIVPATVLDPFMGAGTTLMVADRLGRDGIGIELKPDYASMSERRIARDRLERGQHSMEEVAKAKLPPTPLEALMQEDAFDSPDGRTHSEDGAT